jgi:hypothetical protein
MDTPFLRIGCIVIAVLSFIYGAVFLIAPGAFAAYSQAQPVNLAWLRNVGAALVAVQGVGLLIAARNLADRGELLFVIALASALESIALWISLGLGEFSAELTATIVLPAALATLSTVFLFWGVWKLARGL